MTPPRKKATSKLTKQQQPEPIALPTGGGALGGGSVLTRSPIDMTCISKIGLAIERLDKWQAEPDRERNPQPYPQCIAEIRVAMQEWDRARGAG